MNRKQRRTEMKQERSVAQGSSARVQFLFADALKNHCAGCLNEAEQLCIQILVLDQSHPESLHLLGIIAAQRGRLDVATDMIRKAIAVNDKIAPYHSNLGNVLQEQGRLDEAIASYRSAIEIKPDFPEAHNNLANALQNQGKLDEAIVAYCRAVELRPDFPEAYNNLGGALQKQGNLEEAIAGHQRALKLKPDFPEAHNNLANAFQKLGRLNEAIDNYRKAIELRTNYAEAYSNLGNVLQKQGRLDEAIASYHKVIDLKPDHQDVHNNLANALQKQGKLDEAIVGYRRAIEIKPDFSEAHNNLANALQKQGKVDEAIVNFCRAIVLKPDYPEAHNNLGSALQELKQLGDAIICHRKAIELRPNYPEAYNDLGNALQKKEETNEAIACFAKAIELDPGLAEAYYNLGNTFRDKGQLDEAIAFYRNAIELRSDFPAAYNNLGNSLQEQGLLDESYSAYERAVELAPRKGSYYRMLANTGRISPMSPQFRRMEELSVGMALLPETDQIELHFALGRVYGDCAQHERSFRHLLAGNRLQRSRIAYNEEATLSLFERIQSVFTSDLMSASTSGIPSHLPIFVLGMPRSGTTLVEQIISSHPEVFGAGELFDLPQLTGAIEPMDDGKVFPEAISNMQRGGLERFGRAYLDGLRARAPSAARIVDKQPENFMQIGMINMALPQARIIHMIRDPVDTCLSCFSILFTGNIPYAYDLGEIGRYYRAYARLMEHWRQVLPPGVMLDVRYEDVVNDLEGQARRILAHCDLTWDDRCLSFHQTQRSVRTASAMQVRQPLYGNSVGRWHVYGDLVRPLFDAIAQ